MNEKEAQGSNNKSEPDVATEAKLKEANFCIATGVGIGALGTGAAALGAVCPICFIATPLLLGVGMVARYRARKGRVASATKDKTPPQSEEINGK